MWFPSLHATLPVCMGRRVAKVGLIMRVSRQLSGHRVEIPVQRRARTGLSTRAVPCIYMHSGMPRKWRETATCGLCTARAAAQYS